MEEATQIEKQGYLYDDFRMFHIKDNVEREISFHYHDFYKVLIFLKGNVNYVIEGKSYKLRPMDMVLVHLNDIHRPEVSFDEPYERVIFYISSEYLEKHKTEEYDLKKCFLLAKEKGSDVVRFPAMENSRFLSTIEAIEENGKQKGRYAAGLYANVLFMEWMILFNRGCVEGIGTFNESITYNQKMIDLLQYINEHLTDELSIDELAEHFYISKYHMMRQFKAETGYTIHQYVTEKRVQMAKQLLGAGIPATRVCYDCGFKDYSTFSRAYKSRMNMSPSESEE